MTVSANTMCPTPTPSGDFDWSQTTLTTDANGNYSEQEKNEYYGNQLNEMNGFGQAANGFSYLSILSSNADVKMGSTVFGAMMGYADTLMNLAAGDYAGAAGSAVSTVVGCTSCGGLLTAATIMYNNGEEFYNSPEYDDWVNYNEANAWEME